MEAQSQRADTRRVRQVLHRRFLPDRSATSELSPPPPRPVAEHGLYPGEPETCRRKIRPFLLSLLQLGLLLTVFKVYRIEDRPFQGRAFQTIVTIALLAMPIHYLAPFRWKKPVFVAISMAGLFWVCGGAIASIVLGFASLLIAACFLPIPWAGRAAICALVTAAMAWARPELSQTNFLETAWPIVASMFMFRMMIYLYELKHAKKPEKLVDTLSYFFLLPNYCFMHFPVVDYQTMQRGYFADDVHKMQRRGLAMMFRGTIHLLCYRLIYHELLISAASVHDLISLITYLVCNYLLYLQVSGQFHMACGMLHLFGFQLPETHHNYLLATGFTDYWRRINIYWKDFMVRLFFNPVMFRLKRWPQPAALAMATIVVFTATWFLHAYQSYWLRGSWGFTVPDGLFWSVLGLLVLVNVQFDARRGRGRGRGRGRSPAGGSALVMTWRSLAAITIHGTKVAGTFTAVAVLWSLWSSPSFSEWYDMIRRGFHGS